MKVFSSAQIRRADAYTIANEPISSVNLMERAAQNCFDWICSNADLKLKPFLFFCGSGNNGGDGLALARMMATVNDNILVYIVNTGNPQSADCAINEKRLYAVSNVRVKTLYEGDIPDVINSEAVVVDAILGSGLSRPVEGFVADIITFINTHSNCTLAIDMPSGLYADKFYSPQAAVIKAHITLSLQFPKLTFFFPETGRHVGMMVIIPIGLSNAFTETEPTSHFFTTLAEVKCLIKKRPKFAHKGSFGHALLIAGSYGKAGAAVLAAKACMRSGCGLLTVYVPAALYGILQTAVPEAMCITDKAQGNIGSHLDTSTYNVLGIGPGIGQDNETTALLTQLLVQAQKPLCIDADAINIIAAHPELKHAIPPLSILTPHIKEFERFAGEVFTDDFLRFERQKELSALHHIIIVLKGAYTCITLPDGTAWFNGSGNPGMATAGSGDVLTGVITALLAQNYEPHTAAIVGVFIHGLAGDIAVANCSPHALIAGDIIENIGKAYMELSC